jgi:ABC-type phosphate transport system substrate-binding protein
VAYFFRFSFRRLGTVLRSNSKTVGFLFGGIAVIGLLVTVSVIKAEPGNKSKDSSSVNVSKNETQITVNHQASSNAQEQPVASKSEDSKTSYQVNTTINASSSGNNGGTTVSVNGQSIPVPANGTVHKEISENGGNTDVNVTENNSSSGPTSHASSTIQINSSSLNSSSGASGSHLQIINSHTEVSQ